MEPITSIDTMLDQFNYYFDVKMPDLSGFNGINKVVYCGMGGSGFPADIVIDHIVESYRREVVFVNRDYSLPYFVDENTLIIAASFSGSTEETLSCMKEAMDRKLPLIGMSMGGEISRICSENKIPYVSLPKVVMPRFGAGYLFGAIMRTLVEVKLIPRQDEEIQNIKIMVEPIRIGAQKAAEELAKVIKDRIVNIIVDSRNITAGELAKICVNETGKHVGYLSIFSESNHNELASYDKTPYKHAFVLLTNPSLHSRINDRFGLLSEVLKNADIIYEKVNSNFEKKLYRDIHYTLFFSYLGTYLALENGMDPVGTPSQDYIKELLKRNK